MQGMRHVHAAVEYHCLYTMACMHYLVVGSDMHAYDECNVGAVSAEQAAQHACHVAHACILAIQEQSLQMKQNSTTITLQQENVAYQRSIDRLQAETK